MTIEEEFFKTFGIEKQCKHPIKHDECIQSGLCSRNCEYYLYPEITAEKLLQLICIYNNYSNIYGQYPIMLLGLNMNALKEHILVRCINYKEELKQQVRKLFEE